MSQLAALVQSLGLKAVDREGWKRLGVTHPESVAAHSWGMGLLVLLLLPEELDRSKALTYAIIHDLAEVETGDITPHDGVSAAEKYRREEAAMAALTAALPNGAHLLAAWRDYEAQLDAESRFVRQLDRLDMALQAEQYRRQGTRGTGEFLTSAAKVITDPRLMAVLDQIRESGAQEPAPGPQADDQ